MKYGDSYLRRGYTPARCRRLRGYSRAQYELMREVVSGRLGIRDTVAFEAMSVEDLDKLYTDVLREMANERQQNDSNV